MQLEGIGLAFIEWNGYKFDENGNIYNKDGSLKRLKINSKGYLFSNFYYKGRSHCHLAHTVIWKAYFGYVYKGYEIDHVNNNRQDNRLVNLQLLTKSQNNKKAYDSGNRNFIFGETNPNSLKRKQNGKR